MTFSEEDFVKLTSMIADILESKTSLDSDKIKDSPLYENILIIRGFLNTNNPYIFMFDNEHDNDLFRTFLLSCVMDYIIHKLSYPEIEFNLNDPEEINFEKILNVDIDVEQVIVLILLRIKNGQHFKCLSLGEEYYSITEADNDIVCTGILKDIFNSILVQEELYYSDIPSIKEYLSISASKQFKRICRVIDKCRIWNDNRLAILTKEATENRYSPAGYLFTNLFIKFLSIRTQYPSPTIHKIILLFEYYISTDMVEFDEKENTYIYTEKFINTAKDIVENVNINNTSSTIKDKSKMQEIEMNIFNFTQDKTSTIQ